MAESGLSLQLMYDALMADCITQADDAKKMRGCSLSCVQSNTLGSARVEPAQIVWVRVAA
jgi:hypothetical protein